VEGFRFDWTLTPSPSHVLQIVPFKGAAVEVNSVVLEMEEKVPIYIARVAVHRLRTLVTPSPASEPPHELRPREGP
jgi:hypothetical protein